MRISKVKYIFIMLFMVISSSCGGDGNEQGYKAKAFSLETKLTASDATEGDHYGASVAVSSDTIVIGAPVAENNGLSVLFDSGFAYIYRFEGGTWRETKLTASDAAAGDGFGNSVAVGDDIVVVGAPGSGVAYVYRFDGGTWRETKLTASDASAGDWDRFGYSVAISGETIVIGAFQDDYKGFDSGSAYVYRYDGGTWRETKLTASDGAEGDLFGYAVAVSGDTVVVGAHLDDDKGFGSGSAYIYRYDGGTWRETKLTASDGSGSKAFGYSVATNSDIVVVGTCPYNDYGSAYVYRYEGGTWRETKLTASDASTWDWFGKSVAIGDDMVVVGATGSGHHGSAYVYTYDGKTWREAKITAGDGEVADFFGFSVGVSGDMVIIGVPQDDDGGLSSGSAYVFREE